MNMHTKGHPVLLLVSAPSGAGKTTLCQRLLSENDSLRYSVSVTTREPRKGEVDGVHYEFISREAFLRRAEEGDFLEYAEVHGNLYGTSWQRVEEVFLKGDSVLMDVDVQGARLIRSVLETGEKGQRMKPCFHDVFISPPSLEALRDRLESRDQDAREVIERRLRNAAEEMKDADRYEFQIVNDDLDEAFDQLRSVYVACRLRTLPKKVGS
jgi:guanylate kinase